MKVTVLGEEISMPVIAAPVGSLRNLWPRGEPVAAAAKCFVLNSGDGSTLTLAAQSAIGLI
jgi:isopentenyl diphosphate isomerase/L-lactate dehydrogenase-like FMN-dependent dehydrogenase